jgi:DNA-directed RNA polymerase specialized sigma24 family protein
VNEIRAFYRRERGVISLDEFPNLHVRDRAMPVLARLEQIERDNWLRACIAGLPERDQAAILLVDIEGRSLRDAAAVLRSSECAAKAAHFRARRRLANVVRAGTRCPGRIANRPAA